MNVDSSLKAFQDALLVERVVRRHAANYSKEQMDFFRSSQRTEKAVKAMYRLKQQLDRVHHEPDKEKALFQKVYDLATGLHDEGIHVHKMMQRYKGKSADMEFKVLAKSLQELEHELREGGDSTMPAFTASKLLEAAEKVHGDVHRAGALALAGGLGAT